MNNKKEIRNTISQQRGVICRNSNGSLKAIMKIKNRVFLKVMLFLYFIFSACTSTLVAHPCATEFKIDTVEKDGVGSIHLTPTNPNVSVIQPQFDRAGKFSGDLAPVKMGNKWGYIDYTGTFVIPLQFEDAHSFSEGLAAVKVEVDGDMLIKPEKSPFDFDLTMRIPFRRTLQS